MGSTHEKVSSPGCTVDQTRDALRVLEGRWKLVILFHLFNHEEPMRFSQFERAIPSVSQKMLTQQLRALEHDGVVLRTAHPEVPPRVDYQLTELGRALQPALEALQQWTSVRVRTL